MNDRGRPAWAQATSAALVRCLAIAAAACALAAAPAAAYMLQQAAAAAVTVKLSTHPPAAARSTTAKFAWKTTGSPTAVACKLDSGAYRACARSHSYTKLKQGAHTFTVRVTKGATRKTAVYRWRVDTVAPTAPTVSGGSSSWTAAAVTLAAAGSTDKGGSGVASYQHRSSANGGASWTTAAAGASAKITANGTTWVQFRALDKAGNASAWAPASADPAATATIDTVPPTLPVLTGGSPIWQNVASVTVQPTGTPTDSESGFAGYQYRTSADAGATWSAATAGASVTVAAEGATQVQFRSVDAVGNVSAWTGVNGNVNIDRTAPTAPTDTGGSASWQAGPTVTVSAGGSTDAGSGVTGYEYETSTNGGSTWSAATAGTSVAVSTQGTTLVQFAAKDGVGLVSPWTQATVKLDLTAPSAPTVAGGSSTWVNAASGTVTASGSTDSGGSGLSGYQYRTSTDGGANWSDSVTGSSDLVTAEANTWVQFRSVDTAGNTSAWTPSTQTAAATVRLDRTAPGTPVASGGSAGWSNAASITVTAAATDAGSGVKSYQYETSTNGGTTWSAATHRLVGDDLGDRPDPGAVPGDRQRQPEVGLVGSHRRRHRAARSHQPHRPVVGHRRLVGLVADVARNRDRVRLHRLRRLGARGLPVPHLHRRRQHVVGGARRPGDDHGRRHHRGADARHRQRRQRLGMGAGDRRGGQHRQDRHHSPDRPDRRGRHGRLVGRRLGHRLGVGLDRLARVGRERLPVRDVDRRRRPLVGGHPGRVGLDLGRGHDAGAVCGARRRRPQLELDADQRPARPHRAVAARGQRRRAHLGRHRLAHRHRLGLDRCRRRPAGLPVPHLHQRRQRVGRHRSRARRSWSRPRARPWSSSRASTRSGTPRRGRRRPTRPAPRCGSTARRRPPPTSAADRRSWQNATTLPITASGGTDAASGIASYQYRTSTNGGSSWSSPATGATVNVTTQGTTLVQFRAVDGVGLDSPWSAVSAAGTAMLDQTAPSIPAVTGGAYKYQSLASVTITASGSTDTGGSGLHGYQYRTEFDTQAANGWSGAVDGASVTITAEGLTIVEFRSIDNAGNVSAWAPNPAVPANIVELDRTAPSVPTVSGGSLSWQAAASVTAHRERVERRRGRLHRRASRATSTAPPPTTGRPGRPRPPAARSRSRPRAPRWCSSAPSTPRATCRRGRPRRPDATDTVMLDRTAPSLPTIGGGTGGSCTAGPVTLTASGSVDAESGFGHYESMVGTGSVVTGCERDGLGARHLDGQVPVGRRARKRVGLGQHHRLYQLTGSSRQLV